MMLVLVPQIPCKLNKFNIYVGYFILNEMIGSFGAKDPMQKIMKSHT